MSGQTADGDNQAGNDTPENANEQRAADGGVNVVVNVSQQTTTGGSSEAGAVSPQPDDFARPAEEEPMGLIAEFWDFLKHEKKWWLTPIILALLFVGILVGIGGTAAAPFIYTLF